ncbi:PQQ-dependent sugar dehydrogenase [Actinokineospora iranica]|uniref:LGFP repeat-containing protein n=1 Tax=Actinokineospora iranica TaxID=1271860 RepID=A0A1G6W8A9_9PSEU|nr:PQQ-dependent sugar dehydrogenase [Actinokineospora iranica]SDD62048.1 LGFP repeat-containing protein [Actinokineospora iranica]
MLGGLLVALPGVAAAAPALPSGFVLRDIPTGLRPPSSASDPGDLLTDFAFLPDSSVLAVGKYGKVTWAPQTGAPRLLATLPVRAEQDLGLTGIGVAGDYETSRHIYTARAVPGTGTGSGPMGFLRLSRWTVSTNAAGEPTGLGAEQIVLQTSADADVHAMTGLEVAADGTIWVTIGDNADWRIVDERALRSGNRDDPHGKLLHIRPDGSGVPGNPYYDPAAPRAVRSLVYASGFRSPFRFSLAPGTGTPIVGDVGWNLWEEVNFVNPGSDYGWPCWEGAGTTPGYRDLPGCVGRSSVPPIHAYHHSAGLGSSITGGIVYTGSTYPAAYSGKYFFGDYTSGRLWTMGFDTTGRVTTPAEATSWATGVGAPVSLRAMPVGGDVVFADIGSASLRRIVYQPGNNAPTASFASTNDAATGTVTFDAAKSFDPNGDALTYTWAFGDGATATGATATHTYAASPDSYQVRLTVTDSFGASGTATTTVYPRNNAPVLTLTPPDPSRKFGVGDVITATASATDVEDGPLSVTWATDTVHCHGLDCHSHPGARQDGGTFTMAFDGHPGDTRLEITAIVTDSRGATTTKTFIALPLQRRLTVVSAVPADFTLGDQQTTTELFTVGQQLTVIAPEAALDGVATFDRWSDGAPRVRGLVMPNADVTYTATYLTPIDRRYATDATIRGVIGTPTSVEQGDPAMRWREYTGGRLYWSAATGVHDVRGNILKAYLAAGGALGYGLPTTDESAAPAGGGRYNLFTGGRSIYWTSATGAHLVWGDIYARWRAMGDVASPLAYPTTDETGTPDGIGRYNHFQGGSIYWTRGTGAHDVRGQIRGLWSAMGWERSLLGYPKSNEEMAPDGIGRYSHFQNGSIYWTGATGAHEIHGSIHTLWAAMGWERSVLGYPITNEEITPDRIGRYNHFQQNGSIYWTPTTGAHDVRGKIRNLWSSMGWERSWLGYPTSNEYAINGGRRSDFQGGYILYSFTTGVATAHRW